MESKPPIGPQDGRLYMIVEQSALWPKEKSKVHMWKPGDCRCLCGCGMPFCEQGYECGMNQHTCEYYLWWQIFKGKKKFKDGEWK